MGKYNRWCYISPVQRWHVHHEVSCLANISYT